MPLQVKSGYMIVVQAYKVNSYGDEVRTKEGDLIPLGVCKEGGTNVYYRLSDAKQKIKAMVQDDCWGITEDEVAIVQFQQVE